MFALLCHDFGKPAVTEGFRTPGHDRAGVEPARNFLGRLRAPRRLIDRVAALVREHLAPAWYVKNEAGPKAYRRLARRLEAAGADLDLLVRVATADQLGRTTPGRGARRVPGGGRFPRAGERGPPRPRSSSAGGSRAPSRRPRLRAPVRAWAACSPPAARSRTRPDGPIRSGSWTGPSAKTGTGRTERDGGRGALRRLSHSRPLSKEPSPAKGRWVASSPVSPADSGPVAGPSHMIDMARVLVVVAIDAKQLPIAAVSRIVVVVVIAMMDRELAQILPGEFTRASSADPRIHLQRFCAIAALALLRLPARFGDDPLQPATAPLVFTHGALRRACSRFPEGFSSRSTAGEDRPAWVARRFAVAPAVAWPRHLETLRSAESRRWCRRTGSNRGPEVYKTPALPTELRRQRADSTPRLAPVPSRNISPDVPAADTNLLAVAGRTPSSRFDVVSATPSASFGPCDPLPQASWRPSRRTSVRYCGSRRPARKAPNADSGPRSRAIRRWGKWPSSARRRRAPGGAGTGYPPPRDPRRPPRNA